MTINFGIIKLCQQDTVDVNVDEFAEDVIINMNNMEMSDVIKANSETDIMNKLLFACNENKSDVIFIIGSIEPVDRHFIAEAIKNVSNSKKLSKQVAKLILNLETKLNEIMPHKTICGIRNQTLIIDLSGPYKYPGICIETIANIILELIHLIGIDKENVLPYNVASTSSNNFTEQKKVKTAGKRRKTPTSPDLLLLNASSTKRHKETHKETTFPIMPLKDAYFKMNDVITKNLTENFTKATCETVRLSDAYGRVLSHENIKAMCNVPPFQASTKHGYAILATEGKGLRKVDVENTFPPVSLKPGTCVWVKSGAPIPDGATAVIQVKDTKPVKNSKSSDDTYIEIMVIPQIGQNIKPIGYDLKKGKDLGISSHTRIGPTEIALLAAAGYKEVTVFKNTLNIGVLSIGDHLKDPTEPLVPGFMCDVNRITLISLLKEQGFHALDFGIVNNEMAPIQHKIEEALKKVNVLVTTGSTNDRDLMKPILEKCGADISFGNVNIKPGKSTIFATCKIDDVTKYLLCLSGNPVTARITAQLFLLPLVNTLCYNFKTDYNCLIKSVKLKRQYTLHSRPRFAWTILEWQKTGVMSFRKENACSDKLITAASANALVSLPDKETGLLPESNVRALLVKFPKKCNDKNLVDPESHTERPSKKRSNNTSSKELLKDIFKKENDAPTFD